NNPLNNIGEFVPPITRTFSFVEAMRELTLNGVPPAKSGKQTTPEPVSTFVIAASSTSCNLSVSSSNETTSTCETSPAINCTDCKIPFGNEPCPVITNPIILSPLSCCCIVH